VKLLAALLICAPLLAGTLKVRIGKDIVEMPLEKYVAAVLAGESSTFRSDEALKAMAVAARTYGLHLRGRHIKEGFDLCATTHCQRVDPAAVTPRLEALAAATAGEVLWYQGKPVFAAYSRNCGGVTEDASAVWSDEGAVFLRSHPDPYCSRQGSAAWEWSVDAADLTAALKKSQLKTPPDLARIAVAQRTASGRARVLMLGGSGDAIPLSASSFRFAIGRALGWATVRSDRFEVTSDGSRLAFHGVGEGHGVGMCQRGADEMGHEGIGYRQVLAFYYPGTELSVTAAGLAWKQIRGENVVLWSTQTERDRAALAAAEHQVHEVARRTGWPLAGPIELRVYPDLDAFRNVTGEPGWVAAHSSGRRIDLQPVAILRSKNALETTIRHEVLHVFVETQARPGLPIWFREGVAGYLEGAPSSPGAAADRDLRQTADEGRARQAYGAAIERVAELVRRNGAAAVLGWVKTGVP
jgi:stage II sporulation protein D